MQEKNTSDLKKSKLRTLSESETALADPLDIDKFLALGPYYFYDPALDGPPRVSEVERLVKLGLPRHLLINQGTVRETDALLDARRARGLASVGQARRLREAGHPRPRGVRFIDVPGALRRAREGEGGAPL
jgi:hypothetical protein